MTTARKRPSAAMVVALTGALVALAALVLSLTGTATGLPGKFRVDRNDLRPRVVKPFNVQRNAIRPYQLAPNTVGHFWLRPNTIAARAYARINANGTVDAGAPSFGIQDANISHPSAGVYCYQGLGFLVRWVAAYGSAQAGDRDEVAQTHLGPAAGCPAGTEATVTFEDAGVGGNPENTEHYVMIY